MELILALFFALAGLSWISWMIGTVISWDLSSYMSAKRKEDYLRIGGADWSHFPSWGHPGKFTKFLFSKEYFGDERIRKTKKRMRPFLIGSICGFGLILLAMLISPLIALAYFWLKS